MSEECHRASIPQATRSQRTTRHTHERGKKRTADGTSRTSTSTSSERIACLLAPKRDRPDSKRAMRIPSIRPAGTRAHPRLHWEAAQRSARPVILESEDSTVGSTTITPASARHASSLSPPSHLQTPAVKQHRGIRLNRFVGAREEAREGRAVETRRAGKSACMQLASRHVISSQPMHA